MVEINHTDDTRNDDPLTLEVLANRVVVLERRAGVVDKLLKEHIQMTQDTKAAVDAIKQDTGDLLSIFNTVRSSVRMFSVIGKIAQWLTVLIVLAIGVWMLSHSIKTNTTPYSMP